MFTRQEKYILTILAAINFCHILDFVIMMPLGPQLVRVFNVDPHQFGLLVSSYTLAAGVSGFLSSFVIDQFDRKKTLLFFFIGFSLGTIACAASRSYPILLLARTFTGAFGGVLGSIVLAIVSDVINAERRGSALGVIMGAFSLASVLGVPFALSLAGRYDWHAPFMFLGVVSLLLSFFVALRLQPLKSHLKDAHLIHEKNLFSAIQSVITSSTQKAALVFTFCLVIGQFFVIPFMSSFFVLNGGLPESKLPLIYLFGGIVSMTASPLFGRLADRHGKRKLFLVGALASIFPIWIITHLGPSSVPVILLSSCAFFLVMSGRMVPAMALISTVPPPRNRGSFMSIQSSVQQFATSLGSYLSGLIVIRTQSGQLEHYSWAGMCSILFTLIAIVFVSLVKPATHETV